MSRLPLLKPRELVAALKKAGFLEHHQRGSHLYMKHVTSGRIAVVPMHTGDLPPGTLRAILAQIGLSAEDLQGLL